MLDQWVNELEQQGASYESQLDYYERKATEAEAQHHWDTAACYRALAEEVRKLCRVEKQSNGK